ncbi:hypothetical protein D3C81_1946400 [compost metagenome]
MPLALLLLDFGDCAGCGVVRAQAFRRGMIEHVDEDRPSLVAGAGGQRLKELGNHPDSDLIHGPLAEHSSDLF